MKTIPLTQNMVALVDDDDFEKLSKYKWCLHGAGYAHASIEGKKVLMHRMIMGFPNCEIDHINHKKTDNRKENLRPCTRQENSWNMKVQSRNKTGYKGVFWNKERKKYEAQIKVDGRSINLGRFSTPFEASEAYKSAAKKYFGEYSNEQN
jgi:hypothetical protein